MQIDNRVNEYLAYQIPSKCNDIVDSKTSKAALSVPLLSNNISILNALTIIFYVVFSTPMLSALLTLLSVQVLGTINKITQTHRQKINFIHIF